MQLMNFFIWRKMFCSWDIKILVFLWNSQISKALTSSLALLRNGHLCLFLLNSKHYKKETWSNTSVLYNKHFEHVLAQWRLETSSRLFCDFIKLTIQQNLAIFNSWYLSILILPYLLFQKNETLEYWHNWLLSN